MQSAMLINVRNGHEYAEFFVAEREPVKRDDGRFRYTATWVAYSSFGVFGHHWYDFGHHWYDMGEPFAKFIQDVDDGYLLSKIGRRVTSGRVACDSVRREILTLRRERILDTDDARDAWDAVAEVECEHGSESVPWALYEHRDLACIQDWTEIESQEWETSAVMFVEKLWPKFVEEMGAVACT